ncbi:olfactory receptor 7E178-like [Oryctolagus cuniculus]|uniref:olfactory receptor 7E178-like n=1 Tax=Oryctolagus cuniculus TaxID=9986 RepID=UPI0038799CCD
MDFSEMTELQSLLFGLFLSMYLVTVLGNLLIILAVSSDSHLHSPTYFFLCNLSLADVGFTSTMVPKRIVDIHAHSTVISYVGCLMQMSLSVICGCMDALLLTVMACDRFVAICHPLHYQAIMNPGHCGFLVLVSFGVSLLYSLLQNLMVLRDSCFKKVEISNFFCEPTQLLSLTPSNSFTNDVFTYLVGIIYGFLLISEILLSYYNVVSSILRIPSAGAWASVVYTLVTPMLNPFIYSLRNRDLKRAIQKLLSNTA